ncbi:MAG: cache domain-containing protein, partial [Roseovarius sp.]
MKSVRLRLLILALLPLVVLMPALLAVAVGRWSANYDALLITNVETDLRVADQYVQRILTTTGGDVTALARSLRFDRALREDRAGLSRFLARERDTLGLDFLYYLPRAKAGNTGWPVIARAAAGVPATEIDLFAQDDLAALPETGPALADRALVPLIPTKAAVPTTRTVEDRGMVVHSATPVTTDGREGVLVGGILLNRNLDFIDTINALVYRDSGAPGARQGTATLFLEDVRVSTNVRLFEGSRALGT